MEDKPVPQSREEAVKQWEEERNSSLVGSRANSKMVGIGMIALTVVALGSAWYV